MHGGPQKKTRRGKRAGRNVRERASFEGVRRASTDSASADGRPSMDSQRPSRNARASLDAPPQQRASADSARVSDSSGLLLLKQMVACKVTPVC
jgi:hypothetical protein